MAFIQVFLIHSQKPCRWAPCMALFFVRKRMRCCRKVLRAVYLPRQHEGSMAGPEGVHKLDTELYMDDQGGRCLREHTISIQLNS
jgi:hypothetical protein